MDERLGNVSIRNAHIIFRNFAGEESKYNPAGVRNFCVIIDDEEMVKTLTDDGWNVKILASRDPDEAPKNYIQVKVSFDRYPPTIYLISGNNKTKLSEDNVKDLDDVDIKKVDLVIRPYQWEVNGKKGVKAYLKTMYMTIFEDEFAEEYRNLGEPFEEPEDTEGLDIPF